MACLRPREIIEGRTTDRQLYHRVSVIDPNLIPAGFVAAAFVDWFFDVTNPSPAYCGGNAAWDLSGLDGLTLDLSTIINDVKTLALILPKFIECYIANNG